MRGSDRSIAGLAHEVFTARRALAADRDANGPVDQHRPRDVVLWPNFSIRHRSPVRAPIGRVELDESTVGRARQCREQRIRRRREIGGLRDDDWVMCRATSPSTVKRPAPEPIPALT